MGLRVCQSLPDQALSQSCPSADLLLSFDTGHQLRERPLPPSMPWLFWKAPMGGGESAVKTQLSRRCSQRGFAPERLDTFTGPSLALSLVCDYSVHN